MSRKPADKKSPGRDDIWTAIRLMEAAPFTVAEIVKKTGANNKTARDYLTGLTAAGYLQQQPEDPGAPARWALVRDIGHEAPRVRQDGSAVTQGTVNEQLWRGMTMLREFTFVDLIETASVTIQEETAKAYCKMLLATGYLRVLRKAEPTSGKIARYRLIRNNGPRPPQIQRKKVIFDPNTNEQFTPEDHV